MCFKENYEPQVIKDFSDLEDKVNKSIRNDYEVGYDDAFNGLDHRGKSKLYNEGFNAGIAMRGKK